MNTFPEFEASYSTAHNWGQGEPQERIAAALACDAAKQRARERVEGFLTVYERTTQGLSADMVQEIDVCQENPSCGPRFALLLDDLKILLHPAATLS